MKNEGIENEYRNKLPSKESQTKVIIWMNSSPWLLSRNSIKFAMIILWFLKVHALSIYRERRANITKKLYDKILIYFHWISFHTF